MLILSAPISKLALCSGVLQRRQRALPSAGRDAVHLPGGWFLGRTCGARPWEGTWPDHACHRHACEWTPSCRSPRSPRCAHPSSHAPGPPTPTPHLPSLQRCPGMSAGPLPNVPPCTLSCPYSFPMCSAARGCARGRCHMPHPAHSAAPAVLPPCSAAR